MHVSRRMLTLTKSGLVAIVFALFLSFNGRWHFMFDNLSSFKVHFAFAFCAVGVVFLIAREVRWFLLTIVGLVASVSPIVSWYLPPVTDLQFENKHVFHVMSANVSTRNDSPERLVDLIAKERPDILGLIELNPRFAKRFESLNLEFDHAYEMTDEGFSGMGIYSKVPFANAGAISFGDDFPRAISAIVRIGRQDVELLLFHPVPPITANLAANRNKNLNKVAEYIASSERPIVVLTDLNVALWSSYYREFEESSGLQNARRGFGVASTWPATRVFGVPIDHVMHSSELSNQGFRVLSSIGSDHLPVSAVLAANAKEALPAESFSTREAVEDYGQ